MTAGWLPFGSRLYVRFKSKSRITTTVCLTYLVITCRGRLSCCRWITPLCLVEKLLKRERYPPISFALFLLDEGFFFFCYFGSADPYLRFGVVSVVCFFKYFLSAQGVIDCSSHGRFSSFRVTLLRYLSKLFHENPPLAGAWIVVAYFSALDAMTLIFYHV